jgi:hypothetical protein
MVTHLTQDTNAQMLITVSRFTNLLFSLKSFVSRPNNELNLFRITVITINMKYNYDI